MQDKIIKKIIDIFREYMFRDLTQCDDLLSENIFGKKIALQPSEAYYLVVSIEREFKILFPKEAITEYRFQTIGGIVHEIAVELLKQDV